MLGSYVHSCCCQLTMLALSYAVVQRYQAGLCPCVSANLVCEAHAYEYKFQINTNRDWDLAHASHNSSKQTLQKVGLWHHETLMMSCQNLMYGSTLSPPRLQQVTETLAEYFANNNSSDPWSMYDNVRVGSNGFIYDIIRVTTCVAVAIAM